MVDDDVETDLPLAEIQQDIPLTSVAASLIEPDEPVSDLAEQRSRHQLDMLKHQAEESRLNIEDHRQAHKMRLQFYWYSVVALGIMVLSSIGIMIAYLVGHWGRVDAVVMSAFYVSVVAQVVGLAFIVARYLFPGKSE